MPVEPVNEKEVQQREVVVKAADMSEDLQQAVISICREAVEKYTRESDIAQYVKKAVEAADSPTWHCIAGISFGSYVSHTRDHFLHLKIRAPDLDGLTELKPLDGRWCYVLLFKTQ